MKKMSILMIVCLFTTSCSSSPQLKRSQTSDLTPDDLKGAIIPAAGWKGAGKEYFSGNPDVKLVVPVQIWGAVQSPGVYYLPAGSTLTYGLGLAGGPTEAADLGGVSIIRNNQRESVDVLDFGYNYRVRANDMIFVKENWKKESTFYLGLLTAVLTAVLLGITLNSVVK